MPLPDPRRTLIESVSDFVFGYDYFVAHSWKDGHTYAEGIVRGLEPDLLCFIDSRDFEKGASWTIQGGQALRRSAVLILVLSPGALSSDAVYDEVAYFVAKKPGKRVVTIDLDDTYSRLPKDHRLSPLLSERLRVPEDATGWLKIHPSRFWIN